MKLLSSVPSVQRLVPSAERGLSLFLIVFVGGLEIAGRHAPSDVFDAVAGAAVMSVGMFVLAWHRRYPLRWLGWANRLGAAIAARGSRLKYEVGVDFRGSPPFPRRLPPSVRLVVAGMVAWVGLAAAAWWAFPTGWREAGLRTSYVLYLVVLMLIWALLLVAVLAGVYLPVWAVDQRLKTGRGGDGPGVDIVALFGYGVLAFLVAWVTPPVYAVALCLAVAGVAGGLYLVPRAGGVAVLWRAGPGTGVAAVPLPRVLAAGVGVVAFGVFALLITAAGGHLTSTPLRDDPNPMLLTAVLGSWAAWLVPGVVAVLVYHLWELRRTDPGRTTRPTVHVAVGPLDPDRWRATAAVHRWGWKVALAPAAKAPEAVGVRVVAPAQSQATEFDPGWPLDVSVADLSDDEVRDRLLRRDEIQVRRLFFAGLAKLWKKVKAATPEPGGGHWLAPHWWFIDTVQWEEPTQKRADAEAEHLRALGPGFGDVFGPRVRQHLHRVLRAAEIDLIYVEHGVGPRALERVLRLVFEMYDKSAGQRRAEDRHFVGGSAKVRVMLHEYAPGNPFQPDNGYPEPTFDEVSRFRVLHLFKDRGGQEDEVSPPFDFSYEPSPLAFA